MVRLESPNYPKVLEIQKRDKYDLLILDDISYVQKDQAETSGLFELIYPDFFGTRILEG